MAFYPMLLASAWDGVADPIERVFALLAQYRRGLAIFTLTATEGGVMKARTHRAIEAFDRSITMLRDYVTRHENGASLKRK